AAQSAGDRQIKAAKRELSNWYNNEKRSGKSYATQKDRARQLIADREAEAAAKLAALQAAQAAALSEARTRHRQNLEEAKQAHREATSEVKATNDNAAQDRAATVSAYGLGLGWFTIVCLFIFSTAVTLERIHAKGSGIAEKVELSQYDLNPSAFVEAWEAFRDRIQYQIRSRIAAFAERTPPPPLPTPAPELYDPTHLANIAVTLKIEREEDGAERIFYIQPKRRAIGFKPSTEADDDTVAAHQTGKPEHTKKSGKKAENSCAIKDTSKPTHETPELRALKQRLKDYKKRLGKHEQKAKVQERQKGSVTRRTLDAIENNRHWVEHYTDLINQVEATNRKA
ncbi:MAG: hypothetical protein KDD04_06945, partial [Sinomicrobium sp.]|nr:hypothetical protein [Sinomicrobium sp.]